MVIFEEVERYLFIGYLIFADISCLGYLWDYFFYYAYRSGISQRAQTKCLAIYSSTTLLLGSHVA